MCGTGGSQVRRRDWRGNSWKVRGHGEDGGKTVRARGPRWPWVRKKLPGYASEESQRREAGGRIPGIRPLQPSGHAAGRPGSGFSPRTRGFPAPEHPSRSASARARLPLAPPRPSPPADLSRRPGRGPPASRARGRRAPGEPLPRAPPSRRSSFPLRAGTRRAVQVAAVLPASPGPTRPAGSPPPANPRARPPRGCSSQTMERELELEQEGGRERTRLTGCPSALPGPSALRMPKPQAPPC